MTRNPTPKINSRSPLMSNPNEVIQNLILAHLDFDTDPHKNN